MKFIDLLKEKYYKTIEVRRNSVEVFKNPSVIEVNKILKQSKNHTVRFGLLYTKNNVDMYAWDGEYIHWDVYDKISDFNLPCHYEPKVSKTKLTSIEGSIDDWYDLAPEVTNVIKRIKHAVPQVNKIEFDMGSTRSVKI